MVKLPIILTVADHKAVGGPVSVGLSPNHRMGEEAGAALTSSPQLLPVVANEPPGCSGRPYWRCSGSPASRGALAFDDTMALQATTFVALILETVRQMPPAPKAVGGQLFDTTGQCHAVRLADDLDRAHRETASAGVEDVAHGDALTGAAKGRTGGTKSAWLTPVVLAMIAAAKSIDRMTMPFSLMVINNHGS